MLFELQILLWVGVAASFALALLDLFHLAPNRWKEQTVDDSKPFDPCSPEEKVRGYFGSASSSCCGKATPQK